MAFELDGGKATDVQIVLGHVAPTPLRRRGGGEGARGQGGHRGDRGRRRRGRRGGGQAAEPERLQGEADRGGRQAGPADRGRREEVLGGVSLDIAGSPRRERTTSKSVACIGLALRRLQETCSCPSNPLLSPALHEPVLQVDDGLRRGLRERPGVPGRHGRVHLPADLARPRPRRGRRVAGALLRPGAGLLPGVLIPAAFRELQAGFSLWERPGGDRGRGV